MIDKEGLIEGLKYSSKWNNRTCPNWVYDMIRAIPDDTIPCKDCDHCRPGALEPDKLFCGFLELWVEEDNFCCWGRKNV